MAFFSHYLEIMIFTDSLKNNRDFVNVYTSGKSYANKFLVIYTLKNNSDRNRLGISVSKKVGNSVVRHRLTRLVREAFRINSHCFKNGYDVVAVIREPLKGKDYAAAQHSLMKLLKKHGIAC